MEASHLWEDGSDLIKSVNVHTSGGFFSETEQAGDPGKVKIKPLSPERKALELVVEKLKLPITSSFPSWRDSVGREQ